MHVEMYKMIIYIFSTHIHAQCVCMYVSMYLPFASARGMPSGPWPFEKQKNDK